MQAFPLFWGSPLFLYNPLWLLLSCQSCPTAHTAPSLRWGSTARPASTAAREVQAEHAVTPAQGSERHCSISRATGKRKTSLPRLCFGLVWGPSKFGTKLTNSCCLWDTSRLVPSNHWQTDSCILLLT